MDEKKDTKAAGAEVGHEEGGKFLKNRRQFLGACAALVGVAGAGQVLLPLVASFKPVQMGKPEPAVLNKDDIPEGKYLQGVFAGSAFLAFNRKDGIKCISLKCSHLGCTVKWYESEEKFKCPCHDGWFDKDGVNKGGPPPAPLELLPFKVAGAKLIVGGE